VITAAAIILGGSPGALMLSSDLLLKQIGFAFSFSDTGGCALRGDVLLLAAMSFFGRWNWHDPVSITRRSSELYGKEDAA
jgi:uncharacterized membrane protein YdfJ with MMPL/SSD domain